MDERARWSLAFQFVRPALVGHYGLAIPDATAIEIIADMGPVVEIGAGSGYWARQLRRAGQEVVAYDREPPIPGDGRHLWSEVGRGAHRMAGRHPDWTLLLCWPPHGSPMARQAVRAHGGDWLVYIGEWDGCTADRAFHDLLQKDFELRRVHEIPRWPMIKDRLFLLRRRPHARR